MLTLRSLPFIRLSMIVAWCIFFALPVFAAHEKGVPHIIPETNSSTCVDEGNFPVEGFFVLANDIIKLILGISGALALLMFVYGGALWVISAGEDKRVTEGKDAMRNAVIGLIIIFGSWTFVNVVVGTLTDQSGIIVETQVRDTEGKPIFVTDGVPLMIRDPKNGDVQAGFYDKLNSLTTWSGWKPSLHNTTASKKSGCLTLGDLCAPCRNGGEKYSTEYCKGSGNDMRCTPKLKNESACSNSFECLSDYCHPETHKCRDRVTSRDRALETAKKMCKNVNGPATVDEGDDFTLVDVGGSFTVRCINRSLVSALNPEGLCCWNGKLINGDPFGPDFIKSFEQVTTRAICENFDMQMPNRKLTYLMFCPNLPNACGAKSTRVGSDGWDNTNTHTDCKKY